MVIGAKPLELITSNLIMARKEEELLAELKSGETVFKYIPEDIGEIAYCDSTNPKAAPDTKEQTRNKIILSVTIPLAIVALCWIIFNESPIFDSIVTIVMLFIGYISVNNCLNFTGTDYFVGIEGAVVAGFDKTRDNISSKTVMYFRDFDDILTGETRKYKNRSYQCTDYHFIIYGHEVDNQRKVIASVADSYDQEKPRGYYTDQKYRFWKTIESYWSQYRLEQIKVELAAGEAIGFNVYTEKGFYNDYIMFKGKEISIGGKIYNKSNVKNINFNNGNLIIEDVNHSSKLFGLIEKGDKEIIPLHTIGNREIFLKFFQYFASTL